MHGFYQDLPYAFDCVISRNISFMLHLHRHVELIYLTAGRVAVTIGEETKEMAAGELAVVFPGMLHSFATADASECILLIFDSELAGGLSGTLLGRRPVSPFLSAGQIHDDVRYLLPGLRADDDWARDENLLRGYLTAIMSRVLRQLALSDQPAGDSGDIADLQHLLGYVGEHFREPLTLDSLAAATGIGKYRISRMFSGRVGCGFNAYLNAMRIRCARELLRTTALPVTEVAMLSGFESQSSFYRAFATLQGIPPGEYRARR